MTTGPTDGTVTTAAGGPGGMPLALSLNEGLGVTAQTYETRFRKPRYKLVACVTTAQFRDMVATGAVRAHAWTSSYRRAGNTVPVVHGTACLAVFSHGDDIFLCDLPPRRGAV